MKRILTLFLMLLVLVGCYKKMSLTPPKEVTITKNYEFNPDCYDKSYDTLVISDEETITLLFQELNEWKVKKVNAYFKICGYRYTISWENENIDIIGEIDGSIYFHKNGETFEAKGSLDFLDDLPFEEH